MARFAYDDIDSSASYGAILDLSPASIGVALMGLSTMLYRASWHNDNKPLNDSEWDYVDSVISLAMDELMSSLVGLVVPAIFGTASAFKFIPCDGGVYLKDDYPLLYDALDSHYIISGTQFTVPDLRDRVPAGAGGSYAVGDTFGVDNVTLTLDQIPPHSHNYNYPSVGIDIESVGVPDVTAVGNPPFSLVSGSAGGGQSHENRQPSYAINWYVIAG